MNHRLIVFLPACFFLFLCFPAFSQDQFKPGTIELPSGEKINGLIGFANTGVNPRTISFKKEAGGAEQSFTPATLKSFTIEGADTYLSQIVSKDLLPVTRQDAVLPGVESSIQDRVFLRVLATGPTLTLYELKENKVHYYIKKPDGEITELFYKVFRGNKSRDQIIGRDDVVYHHIFRNQLRLFAVEDEGLVSQIDNSSYTARDLTKMVNGINELASEDYRRSSAAVRRFFFGGGITTGNRFTFSGTTYQQLNDLKSSTAGGSVFKINADFFGKRKMKNTFVRTEAAYSHFAYEGRFERTPTADYFLTINTLNASLSVAQNLIQSGGFQVYAGAGTGLNFSSYPKNDIVSTNPNSSQENWKVKKIWHDVLQLRGGVVYKGWNAEVVYHIAGSPFDYPSLNSRYQKVALTLAYGFQF